VEWSEDVKVKKIYLFFVLALIVVSSFIYINSGDSKSDIPITVYKSPTCGCCVGYSGVLNGEGFDVEIISTEDMKSVKDKFGVPANMESCHTSVVDGYFVEGHVPIEIVNKILLEKPDIDGIAMPGMPSGSPGMPGIKRDDFVVYSLKEGNIEEYARI
jgi:hypothetical protein